jgi:crotonobetaine/carnitine-CoA ligase
LKRFLEGQNRTLPQLLIRAATRNGDATALRHGDETMSHVEVVDSAAAFAAGLRELGIGYGDPVAIMLDNSLDFHRAWFGTNWGGAVEVPVNTGYRDEGLRYIIEHSASRVVIIEEHLVARLEAVAEGLSHLEHVVVRGSVDQVPSRFAAHRLSDLIATGALAATPNLVTSDLAAIMYTSGTTGAPKGVVLPHGAAVMWAEQTVDHLGLVAGETHYCSFPLFHTLAQYFATLPAIANDGVLALGTRFSASSFWNEIREVGATSTNMMGSVVSVLHSKSPEVTDIDNPLRIAFGAPVPASIISEFQERFGLTFIEIYGSSEANVILWNPLNDIRPGSCGKPTGPFDVKLVDANDEEVAVGQVGEIVSRPHEAFSMMTRYHDDSDVTVNAFRNLWFHTGDLARRDDDGYFYFVDRAKDAIRRRGENISSWEIETVLAGHEKVAECAAFGVPSELTEDDVMVVVVPKGGQIIDLEELMAFCAQRMPPYMVPRYVELSEGLPKTPTGKIEKFRLRERGVSEVTWERTSAMQGSLR